MTERGRHAAILVLLNLSSSLFSLRPAGCTGGQHLEIEKLEVPYFSPTLREVGYIPFPHPMLQGWGNHTFRKSRDVGTRQKSGELIPNFSLLILFEQQPV